MLTAAHFCEKYWSSARGHAMTEEFIALNNTNEFDAFWSANAEALGAEVGDRERCFALACNCELIIGGGAAPLFRVGFVD
jgi:hypothetical protein